MFLDVRRDPGPLPSYYPVARGSFREDRPFRATPPVTVRFQALFTPLPGCFSAFPHGTKFAIGLGTYLALEVGAPQLPTAKPSRGTQGHPPSPPSGFAYGAVTLYGGAFQPTSATRGREDAGPYNTTSAQAYRLGVRFGLSPFRSPLLRGSLLVSSPPPTKMFPLGGFPLGTPREGFPSVTGYSPVTGGPIRRSSDQSLHAATRGVSPLATAFLGARA